MTTAAVAMMLLLLATIATFSQSQVAAAAKADGGYQGDANMTADPSTAASSVMTAPPLPQLRTTDTFTPDVLFPGKQEVERYVEEAFVKDFIRLSGNNTGDISNVKVAATESKVYVVWQQDNNTDNYDVYLSMSHDGGMNFTDPVNLSSNDGNSTNPQLGVLGEEVFVLWQDDTPGNHDIFVSVSMDRGETFKTYNLTNNTSDSIDPKISVMGGNPVWLWVERICDSPTSIGAVGGMPPEGCDDVLYAHPNRFW